LHNDRLPKRVQTALAQGAEPDGAHFAPSLPRPRSASAPADGHELTRLNGWEVASQTANGEKTFKVSASFSAQPGGNSF
jgi:hypothetical protein